MNIHEEGEYYISLVRKFRAEYNSKNLGLFCRDQKVSYSKMLHCLRNDSYRNPGKGCDGQAISSQRWSSTL